MILYGKFFRGLRIRAPIDPLGRSDALGHSRLVVAGVAHGSIFARLIGIPLGALLAIKKFWGRPVLIVLVNALMGLPPVVVGLCVYLMLSKSGPLGILGLLYTPTAMIIAQTLLIAPIIAALSRTILKTLYEEYRDQFHLFRLSNFKL